VILDVSGYHRVDVSFCTCNLNPSEREARNQLLRCRLFPSSFKQPSTAFTFDLLDLTCTLTTRGKSSVYDVYMSIRSLTDACELESHPVSATCFFHQIQLISPDQRRYQELNAAVRRYRDMFMHKRAGRGHFKNGIATTPPGALVVESPVLPYPNKNMPVDWHNRFLDKP
jgi:hypothetical protein